MSRTSRTVIGALLTIVALAGCQRQAKHATLESNPAVKNELHRLLRERQQLLEEIAEGTKKFVETGRITMSEYAQAKKAALLAEIDLCETQAARVEIRQQMLALDKQAEAWTKRRAAAGRTGEGDLTEARLARIESEIGLLRERLNERGKHDRK